MIVKIQGKEYKKKMRERKIFRSHRNEDSLYFQGENGYYYKTTNGGIAGTKEIAEFRKELRKAIHEQLTLL